MCGIMDPASLLNSKILCFSVLCACQTLQKGSSQEAAWVWRSASSWSRQWAEQFAWRVVGKMVRDVVSHSPWSADQWRALMTRHSTVEGNMTRQKRYLANSKSSSMRSRQANEAVDMELECIICHSRLYVPDASIDSVLASFQQTGAAILICPAGHTQLVRWKVAQGRSRSD